MAEVDELSFDELTFGGDAEKGSLDHDDNYENEPSKEDEKYVIFVSAEDFNNKLSQQAVIKYAESFGPLKATNFREKQSFGFVQFMDEQTHEKAVEKMNGAEIEGTRVTADRCNRITPGRDPRTHNPNSEFKTATLVLKNLPFQLKQEKLEEILNSFESKPLNVSYLYDGTGMFRGMAFVKYKEIDHATKVFEKLNGFEITGRKVRVEYKRIVKEPENAVDEERKLADALKSFNNNQQLHELAFPAGSSYQKKSLRQIAEKLGLGHFTSGDFIVIKKKDEHRAHTPDNYSKKHTKIPEEVSEKPGSFKEHHSVPIKASQQRGRRGSNDSGKHSFGASPDQGFLTANSPHNKFTPDKPMSSTPRSIGGSPFLKTIVSPPTPLGTSPTYRNSAAILHRAETATGIQPVRQPRGPDGTTGFSEEYQKQRAKA